jgi:hypothetical protein
MFEEQENQCSQCFEAIQQIVDQNRDMETLLERINALSDRCKTKESLATLSSELETLQSIPSLLEVS